MHLHISDWLSLCAAGLRGIELRQALSQVQLTVFADVW